MTSRQYKNLERNRQAKVALISMAIKNKNKGYSPKKMM